MSAFLTRFRIRFLCASSTRWILISLLSRAETFSKGASDSWRRPMTRLFLKEASSLIGRARLVDLVVGSGDMSTFHCQSDSVLDCDVV